MLVIVRYMPAETRENKSDLLWTMLRMHQAAGIDVTVLSLGREEVHPWEHLPKRAYDDSFLDLGVRFLLRPFPDLRLRYRERRLAHLVKTYHENHSRFDAVLAFNPSETGYLVAERVGRTLGIPFVIREGRSQWVRESGAIPQRLWQSLHNAALLLASSPFLARSMERRMNGVVRVECLHSAVSDDFFQQPRVDPPASTDLAGRFIYGAWTRWRAIKRLELLLKAFQEVASQDRDVRLIVAGSVENPNEIEALVRDLQITDAVEFLGRRTRSEIHALAHACHCCVISSDIETFGLPAIEAMAAGKPVVATRCGGPEYIISSDALGRLADKGNPSALAEAMIEVKNNYDSFDNEAIRRAAWNEFSQTSVTRQWRRVYEHVIPTM